MSDDEKEEKNDAGNDDDGDEPKATSSKGVAVPVRKKQCFRRDRSPSSANMSSTFWLYLL
jgi:hypothetical protein